MTTHSPFIVRGAPSSANVYWVRNGVIESENRCAVELALGWGAFGKKVIIVSEDTNTSFLRKIIAQWTELDKFVTFIPGTGFKHITTPQQAADISEALGGKYKIIVHRDRDSLTDEEVAILKQSYGDKGITLWLPDHSDIEAYFCHSHFIQEIVGFSEEEAVAYTDLVLTRHSQPIRDMFDKHRAAHNEELHKAGGGPTNDDVWSLFQTRPLRGAKGKFVFSQLKNIPGNGFREDAIIAHKIQVEIAPKLKRTLQKLMKD